ncbi:MAG: hypothetical protein ASARMPRED_004616 [Alectoria sarmentosa]|nr:MAG: hypothetical protein ASARMPRED_004616 [Alectoria sarmentosa]
MDQSFKSHHDANTRPDEMFSQLPDPSMHDARDRLALARLGKKQVLKVTELWFAVRGRFQLYNFDYVGRNFGDWISRFDQAPTAGGQYHWVSMLAPTSSRRFLSYLTGWMTALAWQSAITSGGFLSGSLIQGLLVLNYPDKTFHPYQVTLLGYSCLLIAVFVNTVIVELLPSIESIMLIIHIIGFFVVMIIISYMAPHSSAVDVFTVFSNGGGWPTQGLSVMVGLIGNVFSFTGADAAVHMAEEIHNPAVNIPRAIIGSVFLNGLMGFGIMIATLFGLGDIHTVLKTPTGYPFMQIFFQATESVGGSTAMASIIVASGFFASLGFIATSSRMVWSFARDRALPFSSFLSKIDRRTSIPLNAVLVTTSIGGLILLISIGSAIALNIILSINIFAFYSTYLASCSLLLWRRCTEEIRPHVHDADLEGVDLAQGLPRLSWGPWRVPGFLGIANNVFACAYIVVILFFSFWPASLAPSLADMNWSIAITGFFVLSSIGYYGVRGRKFYKGPLIDKDILR